MQTEKVDPHKLVRRLMLTETPFSTGTVGRRELFEGWEMPRRIVRDHLLYAMEAGSINGVVGGQRITLEANGVLWLQPGSEYEFSMGPEPAGSRIIYFRFYLGGAKLPLRVEPEYVVSQPNPTLVNLAEMLMPEFHLGDRYDATHRRALLAAILCRLISETTTRQRDNAGLKPHHRARGLRFIQSNLTQRFTIEQLAEHVGLNPAYFSSQFKISLGVSPQAYIKAARIRLAQSYLVETNHTISQIADQLGYEDVYFFSRQFKSVAGRSPRQWRNDAQNDLNR